MRWRSTGGSEGAGAVVGWRRKAWLVLAAVASVLALVAPEAQEAPVTSAVVRG